MLWIPRYQGRKRRPVPTWLEEGLVISNLSLTAGRAGEVIEVTCEVTSEAFVQLLRKVVQIKARPRQTTARTTSTTTISSTTTTASLTKTTTSSTTSITLTTTTVSASSTASLIASEASGFSIYYPAAVEEEEVVINLLPGDQRPTDDLTRKKPIDDNPTEEGMSSEAQQMKDERKKDEWLQLPDEARDKDDHAREKGNRNKPTTEEALMTEPTNDMLTGSSGDGPGRRPSPGSEGRMVGQEYDYTHFNYVNEKMNQSFLSSTADYEYSDQVIRIQMGLEICLLVF